MSKSLKELFKDEQKRALAYAFRLNFKRDDGEFSLMLNEVMELDKVEHSGVKAKTGFRARASEKKEFTPEPQEFERSIIELNLSRLDKERVYEIYEIARTSHNPNLKGGKKLVLKVACVDSCLFYDTPFVISEQVKEQIERKFVS